MTTAAPIGEAPKKKLGWLPLLTVLFCLSYGLMTMLIVEQGSTIESQRALIRELFKDSAELSASKMKKQSARSQAPSAKAPSSLNRTPSTQASPNQTPSSQGVPAGHAQNQTPKAKQIEPPSRPASDLMDERRALIKI